MDQPLKAVFAERRRQSWVYIFLATLLAALVAVAWKLGRRRVSSPGG